MAEVLPYMVGLDVEDTGLEKKSTRTREWDVSVAAGRISGCEKQLLLVTCNSLSHPPPHSIHRDLTLSIGKLILLKDKN